jgi:hypothetical protein
MSYIGDYVKYGCWVLCIGYWVLGVVYCVLGIVRLV